MTPARRGVEKLTGMVSDPGKEEMVRVTGGDMRKSSLVSMLIASLSSLKFVVVMVPRVGAILLLSGHVPQLV